MRKVAYLVALAGIRIASSAGAQEPTRRFAKDVISMVRLGLSDEVIIAKIRSVSAAGAGAAALDTGIDGLKRSRPRKFQTR
jgi:hypothetical protein